jgi:hypothetical protein
MRKNGAVQFLAPQWFEQARTLIGAVEITADANARLQFDAGARWSLVVEHGRVAQFELGDISDADVELRWSRADAFAILRRELRDDDAMRATTAVAPTIDGTYTGPPAPADFSVRPELRDLPEIPGASLVVQFRFTGAPFGVANHVITFVDGRVASDPLGIAERPDVRIEVPYAVIGPVRQGELSILEALEKGSIEGEMGPLALLAGIMEHPAYHAAEVATGRQVFAFGVLGALDSNEQYAAALEQLAADSTLD